MPQPSIDVRVSSRATDPGLALLVAALIVATPGIVALTAAQSISTVHRYSGVDELEIVLTDVDFMTTAPKVFLVADADGPSADARIYEPAIRDVRLDEVRIRLPATLPAGSYRVVVLTSWLETDVTALLEGQATATADGLARRIEDAGGPGLAIGPAAGGEAVDAGRLFLVERDAGRPTLAVELAAESAANRTIVARLPQPAPRSTAMTLVVARRWAEKVVRIR